MTITRISPLLLAGFTGDSGQSTHTNPKVAIFCAYVFVPTHIFWSVLFWCLPSCCQLWVAYCFSAHICESGVFVPTIWFLILLYPLFCCLRIPAHLMVRDGFVPTPW